MQLSCAAAVVRELVKVDTITIVKPVMGLAMSRSYVRILAYQSWSVEAAKVLGRAEVIITVSPVAAEVQFPHMAASR